MPGPPNIVFLAEVLVLPKTKGLLWLARPRVFWLRPFPKGARAAPVVPLRSAAVLNAPESELLSGAVTLTPDSPQSIGVTNPPKAKGRGAVLPNTEPAAPPWRVWAAAPKPAAPVWPKGDPAGALPKFGGTPLEGAEGTRQVETEGVRPPEADRAVLPKAGPAGVGAGAAVAHVPGPKGLVTLGPGGAAGAPCSCPSGAPSAGWRGAPGEGGKGGLEPAPEGAASAEPTPEARAVNADRLPAAGAETGRGGPRRSAELLRGGICTAPERTWLKMVTVCTAGTGARGCGGKTKLVAWEKQALKAQEAPRRNARQAGARSAWSTAPLRLTAPMSTGGGKGESWQARAGVADTTTAVALSRLRRRWGGAGAAGGEVCSEEEGATPGPV